MIDYGLQTGKLHILNMTTITITSPLFCIIAFFNSIYFKSHGNSEYNKSFGDRPINTLTMHTSKRMFLL